MYFEIIYLQLIKLLNKYTAGIKVRLLPMSAKPKSLILLAYAKGLQNVFINKPYIKQIHRLKKILFFFIIIILNLNSPINLLNTLINHS